MKKTIITIALIALIISSISISALAHCGDRSGGRGKHSAQQTNTNYSYELCPVESCYLPGTHEHDGVYYRCAHVGACGGYNAGYCGGYGNYDYSGGGYTASSSFGYGRGCGRIFRTVS